MTRQGKNTLLEIAIGGAFWALIIAAVVTRGAVFYPAFYKDPAGYHSRVGSRLCIGKVSAVLVGR
jgi:hypothetical protein